MAVSIRYVYVRDKRFPRGGTTIAVEVVDEVCTRFALAHCNNKDTFNRSVGRAIAAGRLLKGGRSVTIIDSPVKDWANVAKALHTLNAPSIYKNQYAGMSRREAAASEGWDLMGFYESLLKAQIDFAAELEALEALARAKAATADLDAMEAEAAKATDEQSST